MKRILPLFLILILAAGCFQVSIEIEPKRDLTADLTVTMTMAIDSGMFGGNLSTEESDIADQVNMSSIMETEEDECEKIENGVVCRKYGIDLKDVLEDDDSQVFKGIRFTKKPGLFYTYRLEFGSKGGGEEAEQLPFNPEAMGLKMELIITPFSKVKDSNCEISEDRKSAICNLFEPKEYYVEWSEFFLFSMFS